MAQDAFEMLVTVMLISILPAAADEATTFAAELRFEVLHSGVPAPAPPVWTLFPLPPAAEPSPPAVGVPVGGAVAPAVLVGAGIEGRTTSPADADGVTRGDSVGAAPTTTGWF